MALGPRFPEILSAAAGGADWAWRELYQDLAPELLRFLTSQGAADPEDCLGEVFVQLVRQLHRFAGTEPQFRAWAFRIARSRLVDAWRRAQRRPAVPTGDPSEVAARSVPGPGADQPVLQRAAVEEILSLLTTDQRAVLVLRVLHQFSVAETATIIGKREGAVRVLQHRALHALRRGLAQREAGRPVGAAGAATDALRQVLQLVQARG